MTEKEQFFTPEPSSNSQRIEDIKKAEEMAYTEKPFQDALREYEKNLTDEQKEALKWLASQEGEKAMKAYEEKAGKEDRRISLLRENAFKLLEINDGFIIKRLGDRFNNVQEVLKGIGMSRIEEVLQNKDIFLEQKSTYLKDLVYCMQAGVRDFAIQKGSFLRLTSSSFGAEDTLVGSLAACIGTNDPDYTRMALTYAKKINPLTTIKEYLPYINKAREEGLNVEKWDEHMRRIGYLYDKENEQYISLEEEK